MALKEMIESYINDCIEDNAWGFNTDFGVSKFTSVNYLKWGKTPEMSVSIRNGNSKVFNLKECTNNDVIEWIYNEIK